MQTLNIDYIIIDLEDAIKSSERSGFINAMADSSINREFFVRVPLYTLDHQLDLEFYTQLKKLGYTNFIFPKIKNLQDVKTLTTSITTQEKVILLIESPLLLVELKEVLQQFNSYFYGVGLGSHDLMNDLGGQHTLDNLLFYRNMVLLYAKAYDLIAFDIASMELVDEQELQAEILDGFNKGFDAKFYIHPWQIAQKDKIKFYTQEDLAWAKKVFEAYQQVGDAEEFNPIVLDGEIIEKPHLNKVFTILKYFRKYETE